MPAAQTVAEPLVDAEVELQQRTRRALLSLAQFCGLVALLWVVFFSLYKAFPYVRSGAEAVYQAKVSLLGRGLDADLVIFGNSKVLSGFVPTSYDAICGLRSYNLGLPDERRFIDNLEQLTRKGRAPRLVLLTQTTSTSDPHTNVFHYFNDRAIVDSLFPFRRFPRDLILFLMRSRTRGGPAAFYRASEGIIERMQADRGYYFIEGQSHFPGNQLPPDFRLAGDRPDFINARPPLGSEDLGRLRSLAERHSIDMWFVPSYCRPGEYAPAPEKNRELAAMVQVSRRFHLAVPDYWILPLQYFADGAHLNPAGAQEYTRRLAELLAPAIRQ